MPKVIFDTNIYLAYLLSPNPSGTTVDRLLDAAAARAFDLMLPMSVIIEMSLVAQSPRLAGRISQQDIELSLLGLARIATVLPVLDEVPPRVCRDPNDDFLIATAFLHGVTRLVTQDRGLLVLDTLGDLRIVDPVTFLGSVETQFAQS